MALTIGSTDGQVLDPGTASPYTPDQQPYNTYVQNMSNLLSYITKQSSPSTAGSPANALALNTQGLQAAQANLATPGGSGNPLNSLYSFIPGSAQTQVSQQMGDIYHPAILSQQNQATSMAQTASSLQATTNDQIQGALGQQQNAIAASKAMIGRYSIGQIPGSLGQYTYDSATGIYTDLNAGTTSNRPPETPNAFGNTTVNGVDYSGIATGTGAYSSENVPPSDPNYNAKAGAIKAKKIQAVVDDLNSYSANIIKTQGPLSVQGIIDSYIKTKYKSSPITGQMIQSAAQQYGVDPIGLAALLAQESHFGTDGMAIKTMNPGNAGNTDSGATVTYPSWQAGVNAAALAQAKKMKGNSNAPTAQTNNISSDSLSQLAQQVLMGKKSPSDAFSIASAIPGGALALNQKLNTGSSDGVFDQATAQANYDAKQSNVGKAGEIKPTIEAVNGVINGDTSKGTDGILTLFDRMPGAFKGGSQAAADAYSNNLMYVFGSARGDVGNYQSALKELRAKANAVLSSATNLGVVTGGETAEGLFPDYMTRDQLMSSINRVQTYEKQMTDALNGKTGAQEGDLKSYKGVNYKVINGTWTPIQ